MDVRALANRLPRLAPDVVDPAIAAGLLLLVGVQLAGERPDSTLLLYLAFVPAATLPLAWRRRAPLLVLAVVAGAVLAQAVAAEPAVTFGEFLAMMLATYSVAAHGSRYEAALGGAAVAVAVAAHTALQPDRTSDFEWVYEAVYFGGAFVLGRVVRNRAARHARERDERASAAAAEERARMARDLHDVIAHSVGVMVVQAGAARVALGDGDSHARSALEQVEDTGRQALAELRRLLGILRTDDGAAARAPQPSLAGIGALVEQVRAAGLPVELTLEGERRSVPPGVELAAYRIVQEALTNALKHAGPAKASVRIAFTPRALELEIADDGAGAPSPDGGGHGLAGMRERAALYGGQVEAGVIPGGGFRVRARLPVDAEQHG